MAGRAKLSVLNSWSFWPGPEEWQLYLKHTFVFGKYMPVSLLKKLDLDKASFHKKISEISTKNMNVLRKMKMCKNTLNIKATFFWAYYLKIS